MTPKLYYIPPSPPVRTVLMVAKHMGLKLDLKLLDFTKGEHLQPDFLKINPQHTVPTLVDDDGFAIWDSHAIIIYLIQKYGKNDYLYPKDLRRRAVIDQRLFFNSGVLFPRLAKIVREIFFEGKTELTEEERKSFEEAYDFLEKFLAGKNWMAGTTPTIADYSLLSLVSTTNLLVPIDTRKCEKLTAWLKKCEGLSGYAANKEGLASFGQLIASKIK